MSATVWVQCAACEQTTAELNLTYNLSPMLKDAGFCGWRDFVGLPANVAGDHLAAVLQRLYADPARFRAMNPANGWGDYDGMLGELQRFALVCSSKRGSDQRIGGSL